MKPSKQYYIVDDWDNVVAKNIPTLSAAEQKIAELYRDLKAAGVEDYNDMPNYEIRIEYKW